MIQNIIEELKAHNWLGATLLAIPVVIGMGKALLKNRAIAVWASGLPSWVRWAAANLVTGLVAFVGLAQSGMPTADAILGAVLAALGVEGLFQGQKKVRSVVRRKPRPPVDVVAVVLFALLLSGCQQVQDASDYVARVCDGYIAAQPEVQAEAARRGVSPIEVATAICMLNHAGRFIWELFEPAGPDGKRMALPTNGLDAAKDRALLVARKNGELQRLKVEQ